MYKISSITLMFLLLSCKDSSVNNKNQNAEKYFFETECINYAWGFVYQGTMVDQDGSIYSYNPAKDTGSVLYHDDGYYTEQELRSKYQHAKLYLGKVSEDSLKWSYDLATKVTINNFSDTTGGGVDIGEIEYSVYIYRPQTFKYQKIILRAEGNTIFYNMSESAITLVAWMEKL